ncbi:putative DNA-binding transcriptional regulator YafY [Streptomyces sp. CG 926]|uniref:helix-turn-helix transcriptional regulator n=1 Tax=Streptomyces sp. CG 926 TaxID=1882405 RepID=UPI000D6C710C|nr:YafY family protein [Streptomyces sp. CG 926]PWK63975.1 putative DNA-binding transcriptional regulator YafY [Streptomyces sp. CG 926]
MPRPLARVLTLLELLQSGGIRTVSELADRLNVDERTVRRYAQQLLDLDVPVESVRGRYGGYRLAPGFRMPPLMLSDDEALAVLLGLLAGRRSGLTVATDTASETAAAKIRRVLPERLRRRLEAVLGSLAFTDPPGTAAVAPEPAILLPIADAVHHHRPISIRYTAGDGRRSERTLHPYGVVAHSGKWYVTAADLSTGEDRNFRLDRITAVRTLSGSFEPPPGIDAASRVLTGLATAPYRHEVTLRIRGTAEQIHTRLPAGIAIVAELPSPDGPDPATEGWCRVELRAERLDWLPAVLASMDRPFVIERPEELRGLVAAFAERLADFARRSPPP